MGADRRFPRDFSSLDEIFGFVNGLLAQRPVDSDTAYAVRLAVEELFTNMVKYNRDGRGEILIELKRLDDRIEVSLTDFDADRFDPRERDEVRTDLPIEERTPGGLGIHLVRKLIDRIDYEYEGRRSKTTFVKILE